MVSLLANYCWNDRFGRNPTDAFAGCRRKSDFQTRPNLECVCPAQHPIALDNLAGRPVSWSLWPDYCGLPEQKRLRLSFDWDYYHVGGVR